jgi:hypothetical protein
VRAAETAELGVGGKSLTVEDLDLDNGKADSQKDMFPFRRLMKSSVWPLLIKIISGGGALMILLIRLPNAILIKRIICFHVCLH